jgi:TolA-binding protein
MTLSDVARLAKRPARGRQALMTLRQRFPGGPEAATAAFLLGRMGGDGEAAGWFRTYLREAPGGALRREASGRLLEALSRGGDAAAAAEAARAYLKQYPRGPHAPLAERLARP